MESDFGRYEQGHFCYAFSAFSSFFFCGVGFFFLVKLHEAVFYDDFSVVKLGGSNIVHSGFIASEKIVYVDKLMLQLSYLALDFLHVLFLLASFGIRFLSLEIFVLLRGFYLHRLREVFFSGFKPCLVFTVAVISSAVVKSVFSNVDEPCGKLACK